MEFWDPHFHIWDISLKTASGHDCNVLFAPHGQEIYGIQDFEKDLKTYGVHLTGGVFVEAVSVCHIDLSGDDYAKYCLAETKWVSEQISRSTKDYYIVATLALEDPNCSKHLAKIAQNPIVVGIRQILNHQPSWPRNERLGNLLDNPAWCAGFEKLKDFELIFDLQINPHQFKQAARLSERNPEIPLVLGHLGSPILQDLTTGKIYWEGIKALADLPQNSVKLSMLSYIDKDWQNNPLVEDTVLKIIDIFGVDRCFFASNFPVELNDGWPAERLFGALRGLVKSLSPNDQKKLFSENAKRVYKTYS
ncbi:MAG: amidohydrolase family protein [SAR324 cluster bacterium]|nr:amidohydrolase family protein [SAR324 cluster bacterium]